MAMFLGLFKLVPSFVWKWVGLIAVLGAVFGYGFTKGTIREHQKCEAAAHAAQVAADQQDLQAEKEGRAQDLDITNALVEQKKVDDENIKKLEESLASKPAPVPGAKPHPVTGIGPCVYPVAGATAGGLRKHGKPRP